MASLKGEVVIVTGGGSGIGKSICHELAKVGAKIAVVDVNISSASATTDELKSKYPNILAIALQCDVSKASDVETMISETVKQLGPLYGAVNCAGIGGIMAKVEDYPEDEFDKLTQINIKGVFLCMKYELKQFTKQGKGHYSIVNVSSFSGIRGHRLNAPYAASKHAVLGLTKSAAIEYARFGVRVNAVCPTIIVTPMFHTFATEESELGKKFKNYIPMGRLGRPEEVSSAVMWMLAKESSFTTGHGLTLDGGLSCM